MGLVKSGEGATIFGRGGEAGRKSSFCVIVFRDDTTAVLETREEIQYNLYLYELLLTMKTLKVKLEYP